MAILKEETKKIVMGTDPNFTDIKSEVLGGKAIDPGHEMTFSTSNAELASEMEQKYEGHVIVANYPIRTRPNGATLFGSWPEMPWKKLQDSKDVAGDTVTEELWLKQDSAKQAPSP